MSTPTIQEKLQLAAAAVVKSDPWTSGTVDVPIEQLRLFHLDQEQHPHFLVLSPTATPEQLETLAAACPPATFGRDKEDVLDESYRKAGKMDKENFAAIFDLQDSGLLQTIVPQLLRGTDAEKPVLAELYKLNVYGKDNFFRPHKDTPRSERMFASIVIVFPTPHEGGQLVLRHDGKELTFDSGKELSGAEPKIGYTAFFSDVEHEVLPVTSGHRVTITYNVYYADSLTATLPASTQDVAHLKAALTTLLEDKEFMPKGGLLGFGLNYMYPVESGKTKFENMIPLLKGSDRIACLACSELGLEVSLNAVIEDNDWVPRNKKPRLIMLHSPLDVSRWGRIEETWSSLLTRPPNPEGQLIHPFDEQIRPFRHERSPVRSKAVAWISPLTEYNEREMEYIAYGNEASLSYTYSKLCLVAAFGPAENRSDWKAYEGDEVIVETVEEALRRLDSGTS